LTELVPTYITAVPEDPFTERPLLYKRDGVNAAVYSIGRDMNDDQGRPPVEGSTPPDGDIVFRCLN